MAHGEDVDSFSRTTKIPFSAIGGGHGSLETPTIALPLEAGYPPFMSVQLWNRLVSENAEHGLCVSASYSSVRSVATLLKERSEGLKDFYNLGSLCLLVTQSDTLQGYPPAKQVKGDTLSLLAGAEHVRISAQQFASDCILGLKPDMFVPMFQTPYLENEKTNVEKHLLKVGETNKKWFSNTKESIEQLEAKVKPKIIRALLDAHASCFSDAVAALSKVDSGILVGGTDIKERSSSASKLSRSIDGTRLAKLRSCGPLEMLEMFASGIDIVETAYPHVLTKLGYSLTFALTLDDSSLKQPTKLNARAADWADSKMPMVKDCNCYACTCHNRGYISHLIHCKELLGDSLLYIHNVHRLLELCKVARKEIENGNLRNYITQWKERHQV